MSMQVVTIPFTPDLPMVLPVHMRPSYSTYLRPDDQSKTIGLISVATTGEVRVTHVEKVGSTVSFEAPWVPDTP